MTDLQEKALPETWRFGSVPDPSRPFPILYNYLCYTFARLRVENDRGARKIAVSDNRRLAVFNTGLVNRLYDSIHAVFKPNRGGRQEWKLEGFCTPGERGLGKELMRHFGSLPAPAKYFDRMEDLIYKDPTRKPGAEWDHVVLDAIKRDRLPHKFLERYRPAAFTWQDPLLLSNVRPEGITFNPQDSSTFSPRERYLDDLAKAVEANDRVYRDITQRFTSAIDVALKRVAWNFKTAIPMWFPTLDKMSLLLPLALWEEQMVDIALVVEQTPVGSYIGHTVLPLHLAYMDARLVCRPDSDWLRPELVSPQEAAEGADEANSSNDDA